jgi:hypothetical protein
MPRRHEDTKKDGKKEGMFFIQRAVASVFDGPTV